MYTFLNDTKMKTYVRVGGRVRERVYSEATEPKQVNDQHLHLATHINALLMGEVIHPSSWDTDTIF